MQYVVCLKPSPFAEIGIFDRFCSPIELYCECENLEDARYCIENTNWDELKGTEWEPNIMSKKLFNKLVKLQTKLIEKERQKRLSHIAKYRLILANCSAAAYRMQKTAKSYYNEGRHYSSIPFTSL